LTNCGFGATMISHTRVLSQERKGMAPENRPQIAELPTAREDFSPRTEPFDERSLGLDRDPFTDRHDPVFLYTGMERRALYHALLDTLFLSGGLFLLTGAKESGKTLLAARLEHELHARGAIVIASDADGTDDATPLAVLSHALDVPAPAGELVEWAVGIRKAVAAHDNADRQVVFVIDDAHHLDGDTVSALRLLLGPPEPLRLVLVARPEVGDDLSAPLREDLARALVLHRALVPMSSEEIGSLVWHRLRRAGCRRADLFSDEAIAAVASYANGVPGRAVRLCAATLRRAAAAQSGKITAALVREAARALAPDAEAAKPCGASGRRWYEPCATPAPTRPRSALVAPFGIAVACLAGLAVAAAGVVVAVPESVSSATLRQTFGAPAPKIVAAATPVPIEPSSGDVRQPADAPAKAQGSIVEPTTPLPPLDAERPPAAALAPAEPAPASGPREAADKAAPVLPRPAPEPPATATIAPSLPASQEESRVQDTPRAMMIALVEPAPTPQVRAPEMPLAAAEPVREGKGPDAESTATTTVQSEPAPTAQDPAR
jgi:type II secretory pathway predicted ATPase ExeA